MHKPDAAYLEEDCARRITRKLRLAQPLASCRLIFTTCVRRSCIIRLDRNFSNKVDDLLTSCHYNAVSCSPSTTASSEREIMQRQNPSEHHVFIVRAWRAAPDSPWEFVFHHSGTNQVAYAQSQMELLMILNQQLQQEDDAQTPELLAARCASAPFSINPARRS